MLAIGGWCCVLSTEGVKTTNVYTSTGMDLHRHQALTIPPRRTKYMYERTRVPTLAHEPAFVFFYGGRGKGN